MPRTRTMLVSTTIVAAVLLLVGVMVATTPGPARAAFPGKNGKVAVEARGCYRCLPDATAAGELYAADPVGGGMTRLTDTAARESDPAFSADGRRIAFARSEGYGGAQLGIYVARSDGTGTRQLTPSFSYGPPDWQPLPARRPR